MSHEDIIRTDTEDHYVPKVDGREHSPTTLCVCAPYASYAPRLGRTIVNHREDREHFARRESAEIYKWARRGYGTD